jgi:hypothetical protein
VRGAGWHSWFPFAHTPFWSEILQLLVSPGFSHVDRGAEIQIWLMQRPVCSRLLHSKLALHGRKWGSKVSSKMRPSKCPRVQSWLRRAKMNRPHHHSKVAPVLYCFDDVCNGISVTACCLSLVDWSNGEVDQSWLSPYVYQQKRLQKRLLYFFKIG